MNIQTSCYSYFNVTTGLVCEVISALIIEMIIAIPYAKHAAKTKINQLNGV